MFIDFLKEKTHLLSSGDLNESHVLGHEIDEFAAANSGGFRGYVESLGSWAKEHPAKILSLIHAVRPLLTVKTVTLATSAELVKDILAREGDFAVTYGPKMQMITQGAGFFLGQDDNETLGFTNRTNMQMLFRRDDVPGVVKPLIAKLAKARLAQLQPGFDLVSDYLKYLPAQFAIEYFGFTKVACEDLYRITAGLFEYLFIDVANNPKMALLAEGYAKELRELLDAEIALGQAGENTVLGRGLHFAKAGVPGFDPVNLRNNLLGLLIGLVPTTAKSAAMAYDYGTRTEKDAAKFYDYFDSHSFEEFSAYVRELTRLNPINPGLFRKANADVSVISKGKQHTIPAGNMVMVGTFTAMRDATAMVHPDEIIPGRADSAYLTYGYGLHACFGRYLNDLHVAALLHHCFSAGHKLRREGAAGDLIFDGAFPSKLQLKP